MQTICPYTTKPLADLISNAEHILPRAFGAPENFTVPADAGENSRMNELIDAPAINDPVMRLLATTQGVVSRSGEVSTRLDGTAQSTGEPVVAILGHSSVDLRMAKPVATDENGLVTGVRGFGSAAETLMKKIQKDYARKGRKAIAGSTISQHQPTLAFEFAADLNVIQKELRKIAYLMTVRKFGDDAILSQSGQLYRAALHLSIDDAIKIHGLKIITNVDKFPFIAKASSSCHAMTCFRLGDSILSAVDLFGTFKCLCITPAEGFALSELEGEIVTITPRTSEVAITKYEDWFAQVMKTPKFEGEMFAFLAAVNPPTAAKS